MEKEFNRVRSAKDIAISLILIIIGIVLVVLPSVSAPVTIVGFFLLFTGLILIFVLKSEYKLSGTDEKYKKKELFFAQSKKESCIAAMSKKPASLDMSEENKANGLRIDIYYSKKLNKAHCRVFEYIPYRYEPCSPDYEHDLEAVKSLL